MTPTNLSEVVAFADVSSFILIYNPRICLVVDPFLLSLCCYSNHSKFREHGTRTSQEPGQGEEGRQGEEGQANGGCEGQGC